MLKCNACGGEYEPIQRDGMQYFHACPPLSRAELQERVTAGAVQLPKGESVDDAIAARTYERANKRDENVISTDPKHAGTMKHAGAGAVEVPSAAPATVIVG